VVVKQGSIASVVKECDNRVLLLPQQQQSASGVASQLNGDCTQERQTQTAQQWSTSAGPQNVRDAVDFANASYTCTCIGNFCNSAEQLDRVFAQQFQGRRLFTNGAEVVQMSLLSTVLTMCVIAVLML